MQQIHLQTPALQARSEFTAASSVNSLAEDSHSGRVRASRTRVDESLEGSNPSSSAQIVRFLGITPFNLKLINISLSDVNYFP